LVKLLSHSKGLTNLKKLGTWQGQKTLPVATAQRRRKKFLAPETNDTWRNGQLPKSHLATKINQSIWVI
jgi:hypothetical protein